MILGQMEQFWAKSTTQLISQKNPVIFICCILPSLLTGWQNVMGGGGGLSKAALYADLSLVLLKLQVLHSVKAWKA